MRTRNRIGPFYGLAAALMVGACAAPSLKEMTLQPAVEGGRMTAAATFETRACDWRAPSQVRIRRSGTTTWRTLPPPTMTSGEIRLKKVSTWETLIPGSEAFRAGDSYDVQWTVPYTGSSPLYGCPPEKTPRHALYLETFAIAPAFTISVTPASVETAAGGSASFEVSLQRNAAFTEPVVVTFSGLPSGVTIAPPQSAITESSRTFNVTVANAVPAGSYAFDLVAKSPNRSDRLASVIVAVSRPAAAQ